MTNDPIDDFSRHEVLHMASVVAALFEERLADHRYTRSDPALAAAADDITSRLHDFYQLVGKRTL